MLHIAPAGDVENLEQWQQELSYKWLRLHRPNQVKQLLVINTEDLVLYDVTIIDAAKSDGVPCVVFIIPRPGSWRYAFHTLESKNKIVNGNIAKRIVFVTPQFECEDDRVKADISSLIPRFVTEDTDVGKVTFLAPEKSPAPLPAQTVMRSRDNSVLVEDRKLRGSPLIWRRSLRFRNQMEVVQTETEFEGSRSQPKFHHTKMTCPVTRAIAALAMVNPKFDPDELSHSEVLVIGVGGGSIINYFRTVYPNTRITAVDLNPDVLRFARRCFGVHEGEACQLICADGLNYVLNPPTDKKYDLVITDVNEHDCSTNQTAPAVVFSTLKYFSSASKLLTRTGCLLTNVCCRGFDRFRFNMKLIEEVSAKFLSFKVPEYLNHIVVSWPRDPGVLNLSTLKNRISDKDESNLLELLTKFFHSETNEKIYST